MSDYSTHEIVVKVAMRVSAYDEEHAVNVARELLLDKAGVLFVAEYKQLAHSLSDAILGQIKSAAYEQGVRDALSELSSLYEVI
jgi:hypothetical protein